MADPPNQDHSLAASLNSLQISPTERTSSPTTTSASAKLMDLPTEILNRILNAMLLGENLRFSVACGGPSNAILYNNPLAGNPGWSLSWAPELRLVSKDFRDLVSPVIGQNVKVLITRIMDCVPGNIPSKNTSTPVQISRLLPQYILSQVRNLVFTDQVATSLLQPVGTINVEGCPNLQTISHGPFDPAFAMMMSTIFIPRITDINEMMDCFEHVIQDPGISDLYRGISQMFGVFHAVGHLKAFHMQHMLPLFGDLDLYSKMMRTLSFNYWEVKRDKVEGLKDSTDLCVIFNDINKERPGVHVSSVACTTPFKSNADDIKDRKNHCE